MATPRSDTSAPAAERSVARVAVDISLSHLDRPFDYQVTEAQSGAAQPGVRVRVRFAGQLVDGFVLERLEVSDHGGRLARLDRVLGAESVLHPEIAALVREVADRWAGTFADVVRLAVPPRHAATERRARPARLPPLKGSSPDVSRRVWPVLAGPWWEELATVIAEAAAGGRGVVAVLPDARDVARLDAALLTQIGPGRHVALTADLGPAERYRRFLAVSRGDVTVAIGTRAAVWAPVRDLGLVVVWDDGDDLLAEPRAPYPHARDVAVLRAHRAGAGLLLAGHAVTAEGASLVESGWAEWLEPTPQARRAALPRLRATGDDAELARDPAARSARLPSLAWEAARQALRQGPVLIQVPRRGYQPALACDTCRARARCPTCAGPLTRPSESAVPRCRWCGATAANWRCPACGGARLRAVVVGVRRTAEELGRAFPGVPVRTSGGTTVLDRVGEAPALVVATPGAEPVADDGYAAALLLDGWLLLSRPDLRAAEEAVRRWLNAAALVRGAERDGQVVVIAASELRPVQAVLRWRPGWHAEQELADRRTLHLPPAARMAALTGTAAAVAELVAAAELPAPAEMMGPVPVRADDAALERLLVRVPRAKGLALAAALKAAQAVRSAAKAGDPVRVELDPVVLG